MATKKQTITERTLLYDGAVELLFTPGKHTYTVNGKKAYGVTTILKTINKPALIGWAAKMGAEYLLRELKPGETVDQLRIDELAAGSKAAHRVKVDKSADLGTLAHNWMEDYVSNKNPETPADEDFKTITDQFLKFWRRHDIIPIHTERKLYSRELNVAGTADLIAMFEGNLAILDYKTSGSGIFNEHAIQLGAYSLAYKEETGQQPQTHVVVNVNKNGELNLWESHDVLRNEEAFRHVYNLTTLLEAIEKTRKEEVQYL